MIDLMEHLDDVREQGPDAFRGRQGLDGADIDPTVPAISRACFRWVCIWFAVITAPCSSSSGIFFSSSRKTGSRSSADVHRQLGGGGAVVPDSAQ